MRAGFGREVITPRESLWLGGYAHRDRPSEGKLHNLHAKSMALDDGAGPPAVLVAADLLGLPGAIARRISDTVQERFAIPRKNVMLTSSHTHSGPVVGDTLSAIYPLDAVQIRRIEEYSGWLVERIVESIATALDDLEESRIFRGIGTVGFPVNRREPTPNGFVIGFNPEGPTDPDIPVLAVMRLDGSLKGVVFGCACHNTVLDLHQFSGDYAGFAQAAVEEGLPGAAALFVTGCAGDQNPHPRRSVALAVKHGEELARAVFSVLEGRMTEVSAPIQTAFEEIPLSLVEPEKRACLEQCESGSDDPLREKAQELLDRLKGEADRPADYPYPVQVWRFADGFQMTALGGEAVVDYSLFLKKEFGPETNWTIAYANDVMAYIPSLRVLEEGGYEGDLSMIFYGFAGLWAPTVEEDILGAVRRLSRGLGWSDRPVSSPAPNPK